MSKYATGRYAMGECARSGIKMKLLDMVHDGLYPNLLVHPDWYEPKYPLEDPRDVEVVDGIALRQPSIQRDAIPFSIRFPLYDVFTGKSGSELFEVIGPITGDDHRVALYPEQPGLYYDEVIESKGAGYPPGGMVTTFNHRRDGTQIHSASLVAASVSAAWLLIYEEQTGAGVMQINLGAVNEAIVGPVSIDWSNVRLEMSGSKIASVSVGAARQIEV